VKTFLLASAVTGAASVLAEAGDSMPPWAQWGVLGAVIVGLLITKTIVPGWIYQDTRAELIAAKADIKTLSQQLIDSQQVALPALQTSSQVIADALPIVRDALRLRDQRRGE